jgi:RNA polymerase sigma-70 factor (ECF subfamily)
MNATRAPSAPTRNVRGAIEEALLTLGEDQREALRLRVIEELPYDDVARRLACSELTARQRVSRGLRRLALMLQERGLQPAMENDA